jgi:predicted nucleic acid-binding protein
MFVSNSGPLISFARAGLFSLLRQVLGEIMIPDAVYQEVVVKGEDQPGALEVGNADWITVTSVQHKWAAGWQGIEG